MNRKTEGLEVTSDQVTAELIEIKERIGSLETITSLANRAVVEAQARSHLTTPQRRKIMGKCEEPHTREQLRKELKFENIQALDHHLRPLREADLIHQRTDGGGKPTFEWSKLFKSLSKATKKSILEGSK
ncbi:MAG: helix-turn-helix domain-containing protein [Acidobacteriia bacterium]|nr:helix-turn-helix domain-containing protein [Terriglobia bacterium]